MAVFSFVVSDLYGGGAQRVLLNTANALQQRGHDVTVFILRDKIEHEVPDGLTVINLKAINRFTKLFRTRLTEKWQAKKVKRALSASSPDVAIVCSCDRIMRHVDMDLFYWVHIHLTGSARDEREKDKIIKKWSEIYKDKKIIAVSQGIADDLTKNIGLKPSDVTVIPNPVDRDVLLAQSLENIPELTRLPNEYYVHVARLEPRKRHDWLLKAYAKSGVESHLVLIGDGAEQDFERIRQIAKQNAVYEKVHVIGFVKNPYPIIRRARALLLTSEREGLPTVLIESLMLGRPCISFDCQSGPREILRGVLAEWLLPLGDIDSFAKSLVKIEAELPEVPDSATARFMPRNVSGQFEKLLIG